MKTSDKMWLIIEFIFWGKKTAAETSKEQINAVNTIKKISPMKKKKY